jgi:rhamnosyltransferase
MKEEVLISVIVPVKNGEATIKECLDAIIRQTIYPSIEIIIIDSGSTDNTLEILKTFPVRLITIEPGSFNHGLTRNMGAGAAAGKLLYFTVQDAKLASIDALEKMAGHFENEQVASVCGNQGVPHDKDKNPVIWYKPISAPTIDLRHFANAADFEKLSALEKIDICGWDNVNSMYRKTALEQLPFACTDFAEDIIWTKNAFLHGFYLVKDASVLTWHYHHRTFRYQFRVSLTVHYYFYREFSFKPAYPSPVKRVVQIIKRLIKESSISFFDKCYWVGHNLLILAADFKATFIARKSIRKGGIEQFKLSFQKYCAAVPQGKLKG